MTAVELGQFLRGLPILNKRVLAEYTAVFAQLEAGELGEAELRSFLLGLLEELNPWDSLAFNGLRLGWTNFLKKSNLQVAGNARRFLALTEAAEVALDTVVRAEIEALARADGQAGT